MKVTPLNLDDESELGLLMKTWKMWKQAGDGCERHEAFAAVERSVRLLRGRGASFICVRNDKKDNQIFGFAVTEGEHAHFVYVKRWFRRHGIARKLLAGCRYATFWTAAAAPLFKSLKLKRIDL